MIGSPFRPKPTREQASKALYQKKLYGSWVMLGSVVLYILLLKISPLADLKLRDTPLNNFSEAAVAEMIKKHDFYCGYTIDWKNLAGKGLQNRYELQAGNKLIIDHSTGLVWERSGSLQWLGHQDIQKYIEQLNQKEFGGYRDWRLPTLEEAMSLMEPSKKSNRLHIDPLFDNNQGWIWTADYFSDSLVWVVYFNVGVCLYNSIGPKVDSYVRAVR